MNRKMTHRLISLRVSMTVLALFGFLTILTMGAIGNHMMDGGHDCLFAQLQSTNCADLTGFQAITFHTNAISSFVQSAGYINTAIFSALLLIAFFIFIGASPPMRNQLTKRWAVPVVGPPPIIRQYISWLSNFERSPSFIFERA